jgi:DNA-binding transcriptional LysR family regulator
MTRKDYKLIAEAFKIYNYLDQQTRYFIAMALAERLETDNPRFDRDRFIESCDLFSSTERSGRRALSGSPNRLSAYSPDTDLSACPPGPGCAILPTRQPIGGRNDLHN